MGVFRVDGMAVRGEEEGAKGKSAAGGGVLINVKLRYFVIGIGICIGDVIVEDYY